MRINIVCAGNIKESYYKQACGEYLKRLQRFADISVIETAQYTLSKNPCEKEINETLNKEAQEYTKYIKGYFILLDVGGIKLSSDDFSRYITQQKTKGVSEITFLIGSSYGVSEDVKKKANIVLSFSDMTFPHRLFRVMLLEQIYRAFMIENNMTYHK